MKGILLIIEPQGKKIRYKFDNEPSLTQLQSFVGGYIERVRVKVDGKWRDAFLDEEGMMKGRMVNIEFRKMMVDSYERDDVQMFVGPVAIWLPNEE